VKTLSAFAVLILIASATGCRSARDYIAEADQLFARQKYPESVLVYRKAIQKDPRSAEAYYKLGLAQRANGSYPAAYESFIHAVTFNPDLDAAQIELGNLYLGDYLIEPVKSPKVHEKVSAIADRLLAKNAQSFAGLRFRGYLALSDRKTDDAILFFGKAHAADPAQADVVLGLTQALLMAGRYPEARETAAALIESHRSFSSVYDVLYAYQMSAGHAGDAEALLKLRIANNPQDPEALLQLAQHYLRTNRRDQAFRLVDGIFSNGPATWKTYASAAAFYQGDQQWQRADNLLAAGLTAHPEEQVAFARIKTQILTAQNKYKEAVTLLDGTLRQHADAVDLRKTRATLLLDAPDAAGRPFALKELQALAQAEPEDGATQFQLGRAYSLSGMSDQATRQFELVLRKDPVNAEALLALAELHSTAKHFQQSLDYSERLLEVQPGLRNAKLLHATALIGLGRLSEARVEYARLLQNEPAYIEAKLQMAMLDVLLKRYPEAEKLFRELYKPKNGDFRALKGLSELYIAQGQIEKALDLLNTEATKFPRAIAIRILFASTAARAGKRDLAIQQFEQVMPGDHESYTQLGQLYQQKGDLPRALAAFQKAADLAPTDWRACARLAAAQQFAGLSAQARVNYRRALVLGADDPDLFNNLAYLEADTGSDLDDALALTQKTLARAPGNSQYADTAGFVYLKRHENAAALQIFESLLKRYPNDAGFRYHLALTLFQSGKKAQGEQELRAAIAADPSLASNDRVRQLLGRN